MSTVVGVFKQYSNAEAALDHLLAKGFTPNEITALVPEGAVPKARPAAPTAAANTQGVGNQPGILGLGGAISGLKGSVMPAVSDTAVQGGARIEAADLSAQRVGRGTDAGELVRQLAERGVPEDQADVYARAIKHGYVLLAVEAEGRMMDAKTIMNDANAADPTSLRKEFEFLDRQG